MIEEHFYPSGTDANLLITFNVTCPQCRQITAITVERDKLQQWRAGTYVQRIWPELTPDQRELLVTGTHPQCFDAMFKDEDLV